MAGAERPTIPGINDGKDEEETGNHKSHRTPLRCRLD
jgi:hypothetical protein